MSGSCIWYRLLSREFWLRPRLGSVRSTRRAHSPHRWGCGRCACSDDSDEVPGRAYFELKSEPDAHDFIAAVQGHKFVDAEGVWPRPLQPRRSQRSAHHSRLATRL